MGNLKPGQIQFYDNWLPNLYAGEYTMTVGTNIAGDGIDATSSDFTVKQPFTVAGPRFVLPAGEIRSKYPSPGIAADYDGVMPQIVFTKKELPWERELPFLPATKPAYPIPWLALVLLTEDEIVVPKADLNSKGLLRTRSVSRPAAHFFTPPTAYVPPSTTAEPTDPSEFNMIDLTTSTFRSLLPLLSELPFLSSVRQVNMDYKEFMGMEGDGYFSMILGNRLTQANYADNPNLMTGAQYVRNIVHLVSVEGFGAYLDPTSSDYGNLDNYTNIRLASLTSWDFYCKPVGDSFSNIMQNMDTGLIQSYQIANICKVSSDNSSYLTNIINGGYTPLKYYPRMGGESVTMYRGPLAPVITTASPSTASDGSTASDPTDTDDTYFSGGASKIFDKTKGIFDVSYAVAWQTGRLLALNDSHFSRKLLSWKRLFKDKIDKFIERYNIKTNVNDQSFGLPSSSDMTASDIQSLMSHDFADSQLVNNFLKQMKGLQGTFEESTVNTSQVDEEVLGFTGIMSSSDYTAASKAGKSLINTLMTDLDLKPPK